jgi:hypothetical protein
LVYAAGAAAALAVVGVAAVLLILNRGDSPPESQHPAQGEEFTAVAPWRLEIRDNISGMDNGCSVILTNTDGQQIPVPTGVFGTKSFQMHETGSFRWTANDPGCLVIQRSGAGKAVLPFAHERGGDTDAFEAAGPVAVEVVNFYGNPECKFELHDAADGRLLDFDSVRQGGGTLLLDPGGRSQVYLASLYCAARLSAG